MANKWQKSIAFYWRKVSNETYHKMPLKSGPVPLLESPKLKD